MSDEQPRMLHLLKEVTNVHEVFYFIIFVEYYVVMFLELAQKRKSQVHNSIVSFLIFLTG